MSRNGGTLLDLGVCKDEVDVLLGDVVLHDSLLDIGVVEEVPLDEVVDGVLPDDGLLLLLDDHGLGGDHCVLLLDGLPDGDHFQTVVLGGVALKNGRQDALPCWSCAAAWTSRSSS